MPTESSTIETPTNRVLKVNPLRLLPSFLKEFPGIPQAGQ